MMTKQTNLGLRGGERKDARWCGKCPDKTHNAVNVTHRVWACQGENAKTPDGAQAWLCVLVYVSRVSPGN
jgi:hypothetical protein